MLTDARAGKIDLIITKSISRFARNTLDTLKTIRELKEINVEVFFEKENIWTMDSKSELLITIMGSLAQEESRSISENTAWGKRRQMAKGVPLFPYGQILGYRKGKDGRPEIVPEEAAIVKKIYQLYLKGYPIKQIATYLTAHSIPTPLGKSQDWHPNTVRNILHNEKYTGNSLLQKTYITDYLTGKQRKNNGILPQYYVKNSHPPIISIETFNKAQVAMLCRNGEGRGRRKSEEPCETPFRNY